MNETKEASGLTALLSNRILFIIHLFAYVAVNLLLTMIWGITLPNRETNMIDKRSNGPLIKRFNPNLVTPYFLS